MSTEPVTSAAMTFALLHAWVSVEPHERPISTRIDPAVKRNEPIQSIRVSLMTREGRCVDEVRQPGRESRGSGRGPRRA